MATTTKTLDNGVSVQQNGLVFSSNALKPEIWEACIEFVKSTPETKLLTVHNKSESGLTNGNYNERNPSESFLNFWNTL